MALVTITYPLPPLQPQPMVAAQISGGVAAIANLQGTVSAAALMTAVAALLPKTDPHVSGQPWLNGEVLSISQG